MTTSKSMSENTDLHPADAAFDNIDDLGAVADPAAAAGASPAAPVVLPSRIAPPEVAEPIELMPPCSGSWIRDADGGLTPADAPTAAAAGLSFAG